MKKHDLEKIWIDSKLDVCEIERKTRRMKKSTFRKVEISEI